MAWPPLLDPDSLPGGPYDALAVTAAVARIRSYCGWHIAPSHTETVTLDGYGGTVQPLPTLHLTAVESITEEGEAVEVVDGMWSEAGFLRRAARWTRRLRGLEVAMTHGYAECPEEIAAVVAALAKRGPVGKGVDREQAGGVSVSYTPGRSAGAVGLDDYSAAILDHYRIERRA